MTSAMSPRIPYRVLPRLFNGSATTRALHWSPVRAANVTSVLGTGPPPDPPLPTEPSSRQRVERRKRQAELLENVRDLRSVREGKGGGARKRFWKDVTVQEVEGALQVHLDARPLRHPNTKEIVRLPLSKENLALALAVEWDLITSAQDATRQHLIPLTSLVCRALDIAEDDAAKTPPEAKIRTAIATSVLRYLDTDSLLCWAPPAGEHDLLNDAGESLRDVQKKTADEIVSFLTTRVWPGVTIEPVLDGHSIFPKQQAPGVRDVVQGWVAGLDAWEITGLERAVLAGKSLVTAARFVAEWSEGSVGVGRAHDSSAFGVEQAAKASNLEVDWQAQQWGEVEDTHDVNKEDLRRQLGSVVLLVSGKGRRSA